MAKLNLDVADEIDSRLNEIAENSGISKAETIRKAFALLSMAFSEKAKGNSLGIVRENPEDQQIQVISRVVGL